MSSHQNRENPPSLQFIHIVLNIMLSKENKLSGMNLQEKKLLLFTDKRILQTTEKNF